MQGEQYNPKVHFSFQQNQTHCLVSAMLHKNGKWTHKHVFLLDLISSSRKSACLRFISHGCPVIPNPCNYNASDSSKSQASGVFAWCDYPQYSLSHPLCTQMLHLYSPGRKYTRENDLFTVIYLILLMRDIVS